VAGRDEDEVERRLPSALLVARLNEVRQTVHLDGMCAALTILEGETLLRLAVPIEVGEAVT
jgi:hypothetical protein